MKELMDPLLSMRPRSNSTRILDILIRSKDPLKPKDIRDALGLEMRRVTDSLSTLRRKKLIQKSKDGYVPNITYLDLIIHIGSSLKRIERVQGD